MQIQMQDQIKSEPSVAFASKGQLCACVVAVSVFHIYLAWRGEISPGIVIVGLGMQCIYSRIVGEFPKVMLNWYFALLLFGEHTFSC
jgi:hypothetical protein